MWATLLSFYLLVADGMKSNPNFLDFPLVSLNVNETPEEELIQELQKRLEEVGNEVEEASRVEKEDAVFEWVTRVLIGIEAIALSFIIYVLRTGNMEKWVAESVEKIRGEDDSIDLIYRKMSKLLNYMGFRTLYLKEASLSTFKDFLQKNHVILLYRKKKSEDQFLFVSELQGNILKVFVLNGELKQAVSQNPKMKAQQMFERVDLENFLKERKKETFLSCLVFLKEKESHFLANPVFIKILDVTEVVDQKALEDEDQG